MQNLNERIRELNDLVKEYRYPEAFDRLYNESLLNYENEQAPMVGFRNTYRRISPFPISGTTLRD